jgi:hypothetical protein
VKRVPDFLGLLPEFGKQLLSLSVPMRNAAVIKRAPPADPGSVCVYYYDDDYYYWCWCWCWCWCWWPVISLRTHVSGSVNIHQWQ